MTIYFKFLNRYNIIGMCILNSAFIIRWELTTYIIGYYLIFHLHSILRCILFLTM